MVVLRMRQFYQFVFKFYVNIEVGIYLKKMSKSIKNRTFLDGITSGSRSEIFADLNGKGRIWGKIRQVYPPKNFLFPISLTVREIIVLVNLF